MKRADLERLVAHVKDGILVLATERGGKPYTPALPITDAMAEERARNIVGGMFADFKITPLPPEKKN